MGGAAVAGEGNSVKVVLTLDPGKEND